jgi:hypothetical protein
VYPDFLVIGAQKAGTTWLYRNLRVHPQIWMPEEKEIHYFDEKIRFQDGLWSRLRGGRPVDQRWRRQVSTRFRKLKNRPKSFSLESVKWDLRYFLRRPNDKWYASLFERGGNRLTGETTPDYSILDQDTIAHVYELMPQAKILFLMRSPIERPWSVAEMGLRITGKSSADTPDKKFFRQFENKRTRQMTDYLQTLENWGSLYPEEQIFVGFLEDIHFYPDELLRRVYDFLEVDPSLEYRVISRKIHSGATSKMPVRMATYLARSYWEEMEAVAERFGGYASFWLYCAKRLTDDPPDEEYISYPLWESSLWNEWLSDSKRSMPQSDALSSVQFTNGGR